MTTAQQREHDRRQINIDTVCRNAIAGEPLTSQGGERALTEEEFYRALNAKLKRSGRSSLNEFIRNGDRREQR